MSTTHAPVRSPENAGLPADRLERLYAYVGALVESGDLPGACVLVGRGGQAMSPRAFGKLRPDVSDEPVASDTIFLVASITKPVTVAAAMVLVERGQLLLDDRVSAYVPEFGNSGKEEIRIRHLMTHTSGLPDFLPENVELRRQHAPLDEFVRRTCDLAPDFAPGAGVQYQSTGLGMLGAVVERITGVPLPDFLHSEFFVPLGMADTALGVRHLDQRRIAFVDAPEEMRGEDWGWNTPYWWNLAAPWGGMFTTAHDLFRFFQMFLERRRVRGRARTEPSKRGGDDVQPARPAAGIARGRAAQRALGLGLGPCRPAHRIGLVLFRRSRFAGNVRARRRDRYAGVGGPGA